MALSQEERAKVRYHLGFPSIAKRTVLALGFPSGGHPLFLVENAMTEILPEAEPKLREVLLECDCIEAQMRDARGRMRTASVGQVQLRSTAEIDDLEGRYTYWTDALADMLGVVKNPFSVRHRAMSGGYTVIGPE